MELHLGVIDIPYDADQGTTGDVAEILEAKYKIMQTFFDLHQKEIAEFMANDLAGQIENMIAGAPASPEPLAEAMGNIKVLFANFLDQEEMKGANGVPTQRALKGMSRRFKKLQAGRRPSFIDTGTYQASFRAWVSGMINDVDI